MKKRWVFLLLSVLLVLGGCASTGERSERERINEAYKAHAGSSTSSTTFSRVDAWKPVGGTHIAVRNRRGNYYLLELAVGCDEAFRGPSPLGQRPGDLHGRVGNYPGGQRLIIEQRSRNLLSQGDRIRIGDQRCRITRIFPIDRDALVKELEDMGVQDRFLRR